MLETFFIIIHSSPRKKQGISRIKLVYKKSELFQVIFVK